MRGEYPQARFVLQSLTENCFACHSRLPNLQPFDLGKHFLAATNLASLSVPQQVKLEVATRQFDTAVNTCEALCAPEISRRQTCGSWGSLKIISSLSFGCGTTSRGRSQS